MDLVSFMQLVLNGLLLGGIYALMSLGINLIFGVMRVVNLAHGDVVIIAGFLTFWLFSRFSVNPFLVVPLAFVLAGLLGALVQRYLLSRLSGGREDVTKSSLLLTYGLSYLLVNLAQVAWGNEFQTVDFLAGSWEVRGLVLPRARATVFLAAGTITALVWVALRYTDPGRAIRALSQSVEGAQVCGVDVFRFRLVTFGLGTALAGAVGALLVLILPVQPSIGQGMTLKSFAVAAIGGLGSYPGALVGAILLGLAEVFTGFFASAQVAGGVAYLLFLMVLLLRPAGLLGRKEV